MPVCKDCRHFGHEEGAPHCWEEDTPVFNKDRTDCKKWESKFKNITTRSLQSAISSLEVCELKSRASRDTNIQNAVAETTLFLKLFDEHSDASLAFPEFMMNWCGDVTMLWMTPITRKVFVVTISVHSESVVSMSSSHRVPTPEMTIFDAKLITPERVACIISKLKAFLTQDKKDSTQNDPSSRQLS